MCLTFRTLSIFNQLFSQIKLSNMEGLNWMAIIVAGLVPTALGYLWYGPILGKQWLSSTGHTQEWYAEKGGMPRIIATSIVLSIFLAFTIKLFIHTTHGDHLVECADLIVGSHHTFGHGMLHGAMYSALWIIPIFVINGMFERRGPKNYWIHIVYWIVASAIMGGIVDAWN